MNSLEAPSASLRPARSIRREDRVYFGGHLADVKAVAHDHRHAILSLDGMVLRVQPDHLIETVDRTEEAF